MIVYVYIVRVKICRNGWYVFFFGRNFFVMQYKVQVYVCGKMRILMYMYTRVYIYLHIFFICVYTYMCVYTYAHAHIHTQVQTLTHTNTHSHNCTLSYTQMHTRTYMLTRHGERCMWCVYDCVCSVCVTAYVICV